MFDFLNSVKFNLLNYEFFTIYIIMYQGQRGGGQMLWWPGSEVDRCLQEMGYQHKL